MRNYQVDPAKVRVVPFGSNMKVEIDPLRSRNNHQTDNHCKLLFIGIDWIRKGGEIALETARLLNEAGLTTTLAIVGCSPFSKCEAPSFVEEIGYVSKRNESGIKLLEQLFSASHFLILPTQAEAAGIVFCEASAFGLPIVTSDTGGVATYVHDGVNGFRLPSTAPAKHYADTIYKCFKDRNLYRQLSLGGRREFEVRLNWTTAVDSLLNLMANAVAPPSGNCKDFLVARSQ